MVLRSTNSADHKTTRISRFRAVNLKLEADKQALSPNRVNGLRPCLILGEFHHPNHKTTQPRSGRCRVHVARRMDRRDWTEPDLYLQAAIPSGCSVPRLVAGWTIAPLDGRTGHRRGPVLRSASYGMRTEMFLPGLLLFFCFFAVLLLVSSLG
ncbi:hypothetical protein F5B21DRAFT_108403 [Xylaria acuta]|nr:hypothetical protein F5B21DRAFT_108403 [Xylaria acuta]